MKFLIFLLSQFSYAATVGSITISGTIPAITSILVTPVAGYNSLDLTQNVNDALIANIKESNNTSNGYNVTVSSTNAGKLKNGSQQVTYIAKYDNIAFTLSQTPVVITNVNSQNNAVSVVKTLKISYNATAADSVLAGTYSDTLTFTIASN